MYDKEHKLFTGMIATCFCCSSWRGFLAVYFVHSWEDSSLLMIICLVGVEGLFIVYVPHFCLKEAKNVVEGGKYIPCMNTF